VGVAADIGAGVAADVEGVAADIEGAVLVAGVASLMGVTPISGMGAVTAGDPALWCAVVQGGVALLSSRAVSVKSRSEGSSSESLPGASSSISKLGRNLPGVSVQTHRISSPSGAESNASFFLATVLALGKLPGHTEIHMVLTLY